MRPLSFIILLFFGLSPASSYALEKPKNRVVLTVSGAIKTTNSEQYVTFDSAMLQALPQYVITTHNPWTKGTHTYHGFSAVDLLERLGSQSTLLQVTALNKYISEIPLGDFIENGAIFATHQDGKLMSVRDLGPIMVIYPFDEHEELKSEVFYGRSIWQVAHIKPIVLAE